MGGRYICFIDMAMDTGSVGTIPQKAPSGFRPVLEAQGLSLHVSGPIEVSKPAEGDYVVLGLAFPREMTTADESDTNDPAKALLARHWGAFVAIHATEPGQVSLVRDPSGQLPCYYRRHEGGWIVASDVDLLRLYDRRLLDIDWTEVAEELLFINHFTARTGLTGVYELLAGEEMTVTAQGLETKAAWSPWDPAMSPVETVEEAVDRLESAFTLVHQALAARYSHPLITVSGGLDSSIVATQIAQFTKDARLLTFYTDGDPYGDERAFAAIVARTCEAPLTAVPYRAPDFPTSCRSDMFLPRPTYRTIAGLINARLLDQSYLGGHGAVLGGFGGDNSFCGMAPPYALGDMLQARPSLAGVWQMLGDLRRITSASYMDLARHVARTLRTRFQRVNTYAWPREPIFLTAEVAERTAPRKLHPWLVAPCDALRGSTAHIAVIIRAHNYLERFPRSASTVGLSPLLLAPIVEECLSIPSWMWCDGGIDRSIARQAASTLPPEIAERRSKGSPLQMHARYFETYRHDLKAFLIEGMLVEKQIVDADAVKRYCEREPPVRDLDYLRLLELVDAEIWCRYQRG